jgi:hypothetical protein
LSQKGIEVFGEVVSVFLKAIFSFFVPGGLIFLGAVAILQTGLFAKSLPALVFG